MTSCRTELGRAVLSISAFVHTQTATCVQVRMQGKQGKPTGCARQWHARTHTHITVGETSFFFVLSLSEQAKEM